MKLLRQQSRLQRKMLLCLERMAYEVGSGRRVELAEYLEQVVYKELQHAESAGHDV